MLKRIISAIVLIPIIFYFIFKLSFDYFSMAVVFFGFMALFESLYMIEKRFRGCNKKFIVFSSGISVILFLIFFLRGVSFFNSHIISLLFFTLLLSPILFSKKMEIEVIFASLIFPIFFYFYIFVLFTFSILIRFNLHIEKGSYLILLWLLINWFGDSFAYFGGKFLGRHKLSPKVSPKKTIEGGIFGVVGGVVAAILIHSLFLKNYSFSGLIFISIITQIVGQMGDLIESVIKRFFGVKDSSNLIPGHGGVFDRIDSLILSAPIFYYFFKYFLV